MLCERADAADQLRAANGQESDVRAELAEWLLADDDVVEEPGAPLAQVIELGSFVKQVNETLGGGG